MFVSSLRQAQDKPIPSLLLNHNIKFWSRQLLKGKNRIPRSETCYLINLFHIKVCPDHFGKSFVAVFPDIAVIQYATVLQRCHVNTLILPYLFNQPLSEFIIVKNPVNIGTPDPSSHGHRSIFYSNILTVSTGDQKERPCTIPAGSVPHMYLISLYIHPEDR